MARPLEREWSFIMNSKFLRPENADSIVSWGKIWGGKKHELHPSNLTQLMFCKALSPYPRRRVRRVRRVAVQSGAAFRIHQPLQKSEDWCVR